MQGSEVAAHCCACLLIGSGQPATGMEIITDALLLSEDVESEQKESLSALFRRKVGAGDTSVAGAVAKLRGDRTLEDIHGDQETQGIVKEAGLQLLGCGSQDTQYNVCCKILEEQPSHRQFEVAMDLARRLDDEKRVELVQCMLGEGSEDFKTQALEGHVPKGVQEELDALHEALEEQAAVSVAKAKEAAAELETSLSAARRALKKARGGLLLSLFPCCSSSKRKEAHAFFCPLLPCRPEARSRGSRRLLPALQEPQCCRLREALRDPQSIPLWLEAAPMISFAGLLPCSQETSGHRGERNIHTHSSFPLSPSFIPFSSQ